jgi:hypothetical protein
VNASKLQSRREEKCARQLATDAMFPCRVRRAEWELLVEARGIVADVQQVR